MYRLATAIFLLSAPAFAQTANPPAVANCPAIGQTASGELVYSLDCKGIKTNTTVGEYKPNMPDTNMKDTVIPKPGGVQQPDTTPTKGETR